MIKIKTRFGDVEYDPGQLLVFQVGMIGFPNLRNFIIMPNHEQKTLFWIQSVDDPDVAFILTDPVNFFPDYKVKLGAAERQILGIGEGDECSLLVVATVPPDRNITLNMLAPIWIAPKTNRAVQIILEDSPYSTKTPLPKA